MALHKPLIRRHSADHVHINTAKLCRESATLRSWFRAVREDYYRVADSLVLARANANRLHDEAYRLEALRRKLEANNDAFRHFARAIRYADCDVFDDPELLIEINEQSLECERCGKAETLVAVIRFPALSEVLAICGECFRQLGELSLGAVV